MFRTPSKATLLLALQLLAGCRAAEPPSNDPCYLPKICTPAQAIACARKANFGSDFYKSVINDIVTLTEPYVFLDILKNPPQPEGFSGYFKAVDLIADLKNINTNPASFYDFYRALQRVLMSTQDRHFGYFFPGNENYEHKIANFFALVPMDLYTVDVDGTPKMFSAPSFNEGAYNYFENGTEIYNTIVNNLDVPLSSINGKTPFEFVLGFGKEYYNNMKNLNAKYTIASSKFSRVLSLQDFPLDVSDFTGMTFVYENGVTIKTDLPFINLDPQMETNQTNDLKNKMSFNEYVRTYVRDNKNRVGDLDLVKLMEEWERGEDVPVKKTLTDREALEELKKIDIKKIVAQPAKRALTEGGWDYATKDGILKCREENDNEMNVYYINSFSSEDVDDFIRVLTNCARMFDMNSYPIVVINEKNGGGIAHLSTIFQETLQPDMVTRLYTSYKDDTKTRKALDEMGFYNGFGKADTCESIGSIEEMYEDPEMDTFGNGIIHIRTKPHLMSQIGTSETMMNLRPLLKHRKKPTEIVVFTDSYSFSAGSILTKGLKEAGAAIIVGYNGYPGSSKKTFDIGQSPTNCIQDELNLFDEEAYYRLSEKGIILASLSVGETYRVRDIQMRNSSSKTLVPREFLFDAPDERVPIYNYYTYKELVSTAKDIIEKYKTQCNPDNPRLHLRDSACDEIINKTHMHGGYVCGADGKWSTKCEGYYCDDGFLYDAGTDSCIQDLCPEMVLIEGNIRTLGYVIMILIAMVMLVVVLAIGASVFFCCCLRKPKPRDVEYQSV